MVSILLFFHPVMAVFLPSYQITALHARHKRTLFCRELPLVSLSCLHPSILFVLERNLVGVFKRGDNMVAGEMPVIKVLSLGRPLIMVDVTGTKRFFQATLELLFSCPSVLILFTNPSARAGYDTRSIFKQSLTGLNSEFSFS